VESSETPNARYHAARPVSPFVIRALAIGHLAFAALLFGSAFLNNTFEGSDLDKNLAASIGKIDSPQARSMQKTLERTIQVKDGLRKHLASRLPSSVWVTSLNQTVDVALALLLAGAGICLLQRQPLARPLSLAFAGVCLTQKLLMMGYLSLAEVPAATKYFEPLLRMYPKEADLFQGILGPIASGPAYQLLFAIYPLVVLALMWQPGMATALATTAEPEPVRPPREVDVATRIVPPLSSTVAKKVSPSQIASAIDPLEAMLNKKAF
jgi:hypothetical protein